MSSIQFGAADKIIFTAGDKIAFDCGGCCDGGDPAAFFFTASGLTGGCTDGNTTLQLDRSSACHWQYTGGVDFWSAIYAQITGPVGGVYTLTVDCWVATTPATHVLTLTKTFASKPTCGTLDVTTWDSIVKNPGWSCDITAAGFELAA